MVKIWVVIDEGCQECGVASEPVGCFATAEEAKTACDAREKVTNGWRDGGQTDARVYDFDLPVGVA